MNAAFEEISKRFGDAVILNRSEGEIRVQAFVQPVTSLDKRFYKSLVTEVGVTSEMRYLYLGPAEQEMKTVESLSCRGREYEVLRAETIYGGGAPIYCWALLRALDD